MRRIALLAIVVGFLAPLAAAPAHAQASRTWVSGVGDDANPCSRTAPCKTFAGAISKTAAFGEINCLDPGGFGGITITKSMTLNCHEVFGSILVAGTPGVTINAAATDKIVLRNLQIQGLQGTATPGTIGVRILAAAQVSIEDCVITQFSQQGIFDTRSTANGKLFVKNTTLSNNAGAGVSVAAAATGNATFERVYSIGNLFGVAIGTGNNLMTNRSVFSGNTNAGVQSDAGSQVIVDSATINNNGTGVVAGGSVRIGNSDVTFNTTAFSGSTTTYGNNRVDLNGSPGTPLVAAGGATTDLGQR